MTNKIKKKQAKKVRETVQDLKNQMEVKKKTQTEGRLGMGNMGKRTGNYRDKYYYEGCVHALRQFN